MANLKTITIDDIGLNVPDSYTKAEVNALIGSIQGARIEVVQSLPQTGETNVIYLVPKQSAQTDNVYDEYVWANNNFERIGDTEIDLSNYYTKTQADALLGDKQDELTAGNGITISSTNVISVTLYTEYDESTTSGTWKVRKYADGRLEATKKNADGRTGTLTQVGSTGVYYGALYTDALPQELTSVEYYNAHVDCEVDYLIQVVTTLVSTTQAQGRYVRYGSATPVSNLMHFSEVKGRWD